MVVVTNYFKEIAEYKMTQANNFKKNTQKTKITTFHINNPQDIFNGQCPILCNSKEHFFYSISLRLQDYLFQVI